MTIEPTLIADAIANFFGAAGAFVLARDIRRADPLGAVTARISFVLHFVSAFFLLRAFSWATQNELAFHTADGLAAATPLVSLIVAEGLLRRHAPRWLKLALTAGPVIVMLAKVLPVVPPSAANGLLAATVVGGFLCVAGLLWRRDQSSLTDAENLNIRRVLLALLALAPLILTDFRSIWPDIPVRLGAVGALLLLYLGFGTGDLESSSHSRLGSIVTFAAIAVVFAFGYAAIGEAVGTSQLLRVAAVGFSGLLFAAIFSETRGAASERNRKTGPLLVATSLDAFEAALKDHPLLNGGRILQGEALAHTFDPSFEALLADKPVLRRSAAPWGRSPFDGGVERAMSLMTAYDATDIAVLTHKPLRVLVLTLPAIARDARSEADIQLARLVGELSFLKADRA